MKVTLAVFASLLTCSPLVLATPGYGYGSVTVSSFPTAGPTGTGASSGLPVPTGSYVKARSAHGQVHKIKRGSNFLSDGSWNETAEAEVRQVAQPLLGRGYPSGTAPAGPTGTGPVGPTGTTGPIPTGGYGYGPY